MRGYPLFVTNMHSIKTYIIPFITPHPRHPNSPTPALLCLLVLRFLMRRAGQRLRRAHEATGIAAAVQSCHAVQTIHCYSQDMPRPAARRKMINQHKPVLTANSRLSGFKCSCRALWQGRVVEGTLAKTLRHMKHIRNIND